MQDTFVSVPERQCKHAVRPPQRFFETPRVDRGQHDFGVGVAAKPSASCTELVMQFAKVVDLAIEDRDVALRVRMHRLTPFGRQVDDG
jgi:hypothetical protein